MTPLAKLRKTVKRWNKEHSGSALHVVNVGCMDLCPKGGVTVCDAGRDATALVIVRSVTDLRALAE